MQTDNFAWTVTDEHGELLAYMEKPVQGQPAPTPQFLDREKAEKQCLDLIEQAVKDTRLPFEKMAQYVMSQAYVYRAMQGPSTMPPKSKIIMP